MNALPHALTALARETARRLCDLQAGLALQDREDRMAALRQQLNETLESVPHESRRVFRETVFGLITGEAAVAREDSSPAELAARVAARWSEVPEEARWRLMEAAGLQARSVVAGATLEEIAAALREGERFFEDASSWDMKTREFLVKGDPASRVAFVLATLLLLVEMCECVWTDWKSIAAMARSREPSSGKRDQEPGVSDAVMGLLQAKTPEAVGRVATRLHRDVRLLSAAVGALIASPTEVPQNLGSWMSERLESDLRSSQGKAPTKPEWDEIRKRAFDTVNAGRVVEEFRKRLENSLKDSVRQAAEIFAIR